MIDSAADRNVNNYGVKVVRNVSCDLIFRILVFYNFSDSQIFELQINRLDLKLNVLNFLLTKLK